ncbi:MAG: hypothetical protein ACREPR_24910 [Brasilonema sp.]
MPTTHRLMFEGRSFGYPIVKPLPPSIRYELMQFSTKFAINEVL